MTVSSSEESVSEFGDGSGKGVCDGVLNKLNDGALEEDFESGSEISPDVTPDLDVNVVAVDVDKDVNGVHSGDNAAISKGLGLERKTKSDVDGVHLHLGMALGDKDPRVSTERVRVEVGAQVVAGKFNGVVGDINIKDDISGVLRYRDMVAVQVIFAITDIGQLQVVEELED